MEDALKQRNNFIAYEYKEIFAKSSQVSFLMDAYENFGWEPDENLSGNNMNVYPGHGDRLVIRLKRNRKIINKTELTRLQRNFEACVDEIQALEKSKTSMATMWALIAGIAGTAFMAGSTFAVTAQPPHILLCIILAVPGFLGWIIPFFLYKKISWKQSQKITPLIEEKYNEIYELCEKGNKLLFHIDRTEE